MNLKNYFESLIEKVEGSDFVSNAGKDEGGFYSPTRTIVLTKLNFLKDLHHSAAAKPMLREAWKVVVEHVPPEMLVLDDEQKIELKKMLA